MKYYALEETPYGFTWGPVEVERLCSEPDDWGALLAIKTPRERLDIRVTPSGLIRVGKPVRAKK